MNNKKDIIYKEVHDICVNSLKDSNKKIHMEKLLKYCIENRNIYKYVWNQNGIPLLLLQEIITPYFYVNTPQFTKEMSDLLTISLKILNYLVIDDEIKKIFVDARYHFYLFRYIMNYDSQEIYEKPRLTILRIFKEIIQNDYVQSQIKNTEIVPIILKNIDLGSLEVKKLSFEIFYNLISTDDGLNYVSQTFDRFSAINQVMNALCGVAQKNRSMELIKWILMVYIRLCSKEHIKNALKVKNPANIMNEDLKKIVTNDIECEELYKELVCLIRGE